MKPDARPGIAIGHLSLSTPDIDATLALFDALGARNIFRKPDMAILEIRGGTHLIVRRGPAAAPGFDLMVDALPEVHGTLSARGLRPEPIQPGRIHSSFRVVDQAGIAHKLTSSHVVGPV